MGTRTMNTHLAAVIAFLNWSVDTHRLTANPLTRLHKADEKSGQRRKRRALTVEEIKKLLNAARVCPLAEALTIRRAVGAENPLAPNADLSRTQELSAENREDR